VPGAGVAVRLRSALRAEQWRARATALRAAWVLGGARKAAGRACKSLAREAVDVGQDQEQRDL